MDFSNLTLISPPIIDSRWTRADIWGAVKVRSSIGRNRYQVKPGLYKLGKPGSSSEVFVSSNYKLSFDILRRSLSGMDAWILILQTYGVNVWCAAGKGSFGTDELIRQVKDSGLGNYVEHKRVIVPQLGAPGVSAHLVKEATGFSVKFGPVRAEDIKDYISAGYKKDEVTRSVQFNFKDRILLTPVEVMNSWKYLIIAILFFGLLSGIYPGGYSFPLILKEGPGSLMFLLMAYFTGAVLTPALLPWIPFRYFGGKGLITGLLTCGLLIVLAGVELAPMEMIAWCLISGAISSFLAMNFTGASTFTSLSGVRKEMKLFVPVQLSLSIMGLALLIISKLIQHG
ncbi:MAG: mercury methylation corrinoid protein HgcA [Bacteroides sp.]|nr:mercury methylation corrinoid protein HgcA [Bacteroides sp.]